MDPDLFGVMFIVTGDLDPSYFLFERLCRLDRRLAHRLVVAHMLFYHIGTSSQIAASPDFWGAAFEAARSREWPRGRERRHFRGEFATRTVAELCERFPEPEDIIPCVYAPTFKATTDRAYSLPGMGAYFAFKIPDIMERCLGYRIAEDDSILKFNPVPAQALKEFSAHSGVRSPELLAHLQEVLSVLPAPPNDNRACGLQEIETILCTSREAWQKGVGSYYIGWDIKKHRKNLKEPFDDPLKLEGFLPYDPSERVQGTYYFHRPPKA